MARRHRQEGKLDDRREGKVGDVFFLRICFIKMLAANCSRKECFEVLQAALKCYVTCCSMLLCQASSLVLLLFRANSKALHSSSDVPQPLFLDGSYQMMTYGRGVCRGHGYVISRRQATWRLGKAGDRRRTRALREIFSTHAFS
jgi:hypothetical protein